MQHFGKISQNCRINRVGLGIFAHGHREGSGPTRIDSEHLEIRLLQCRHDLALVASRGLQQYPANLIAAQSFDQLNKAFRCVWNLEAFFLRLNPDNKV